MKNPLLVQEPKWHSGANKKKVLALTLIFGLCVVGALKIKQPMTNQAMRTESALGLSTEPTLWSEDFEKKHLLYKPADGNVNTQLQAFENHVSRVAGRVGAQTPAVNTMIDLATQDVAKDTFKSSIHRMQDAYAKEANRVECHPPKVTPASQGGPNCMISSQKFRTFRTKFQDGGTDANTKAIKAAFQNWPHPWAAPFWTAMALPQGYDQVKLEDEVAYLKIGFKLIDGKNVANHYAGISETPGEWSKASKAEE